MNRRKVLLILSAFIFSISLNADNRASVIINDSWLYAQGDVGNCQTSPLYSAWLWLTALLAAALLRRRARA